jgi:hypothetical protein
MRHISSFTDAYKTAANLATAPLEEDDDHQAISRAAIYLAASGRGTAVYQTQHADHTTVWTYQDRPITVPLQPGRPYKDPYD